MAADSRGNIYTTERYEGKHVQNGLFIATRKPDAWTLRLGLRCRKELADRLKDYLELLVILLLQLCQLPGKVLMRVQDLPKTDKGPP